MLLSSSPLSFAFPCILLSFLSLYKHIELHTDFSAVAGPVVELGRLMADPGMGRILNTGTICEMIWVGPNTCHGFCCVVIPLFLILYNSDY